MGLYSGWEEEYDRKQYLREEARYEAEREREWAEVVDAGRDASHRAALADLFRECTLDDPCGACPGCCQHEQGGEA